MAEKMFRCLRLFPPAVGCVLLLTSPGCGFDDGRPQLYVMVVHSSVPTQVAYNTSAGGRLGTTPLEVTYSSIWRPVLHLDAGSDYFPVTAGLGWSEVGEWRDGKWHVELLPHPRVASRELAKVIESGDYYGAEETRLRRIDRLKKAIVFQNTTVYEGHFKKPYDSAHVELMKVEIVQLEHLVGLADPVLMALRKQLLASVQAGQIEKAKELAGAVANMEQKYFPQPTPIVAQAPVGSSPQPGSQTITVQQKPYYGATHVLDALSRMSGRPVSPKAFGAATMLDILGIGAVLNP